MKLSSGCRSATPTNPHLYGVFFQAGGYPFRTANARGFNGELGVFVDQRSAANENRIHAGTQNDHAGFIGGGG